MKKIIGILSILCLLFVSFLSSEKLVEKNKDVSLANLITNANAQSEWWDPPCPWCPNQPYGEVQVPYTELCYDLLQDPDEPMVFIYYPYTGEGIICEAAQSMGPLDCSPISACDEENVDTNV